MDISKASRLGQNLIINTSTDVDNIKSEVVNKFSFNEQAQDQFDITVSDQFLKSFDKNRDALIEAIYMVKTWLTYNPTVHPFYFSMTKLHLDLGTFYIKCYSNLIVLSKLIVIDQKRLKIRNQANTLLQKWLEDPTSELIPLFLQFP